jgi:2'-5' RNA ligase
VFPAAGAPRVVWLDIVGGAMPLGRIHAELGRRLKDAAFALEPRALSPHLTIARVPDRERSRIGDVRERLHAVAPMPIAWMADRVVLFRSNLSGPVPRYEGLQEIALGIGGEVPGASVE